MLCSMLIVHRNQLVTRMHSFISSQQGRKELIGIRRALAPEKKEYLFMY